LPGECPPFELTKARVLREGVDAMILAYGTMVAPALEAAEYLARTRGIEVAVVNARFAKPLDVSTIGRYLTSGKPMLIVEEHAKIGGLGSAVLELAAERGWQTSPIRSLGIPDRFVAHASRSEQLEDVGLTPQNIAETLCDMLTHPVNIKQPAE
jgi:1-deoxy-D-xylulose-5-phosphate synthase